jgi:hypothetical protein
MSRLVFEHRRQAMERTTEVAEAIDGAGENISRALKWLGNADAATSMGGLEAHGAVIKEAGERIAAAIHDLADAIREHAD